MQKRTQISDVLNYMTKHKKGITSLEAIQMFGATRLSGIIWCLRQDGHNIETETKEVKNRYGGVSRVACYKLMD